MDFLGLTPLVLKIIEHIGHRDARAPDARLPAANARVDGDAFQVIHAAKVSFRGNRIKFPLGRGVFPYAAGAARWSSACERVGSSSRLWLKSSSARSGWPRWAFARSSRALITASYSAPRAAATAARASDTSPLRST